MPYDLKIAQCLIAMHQYMGAHQYLRDKTSIEQTKFDKEFCRDIPESLENLSNFVYNNDPLKSYEWMPSFEQDIRLN